MSASLVGSEMCIRDRLRSSSTATSMLTSLAPAATVRRRSLSGSSNGCCLAVWWPLVRPAPPV
eukprot:9614612-Alexandrium_andersonii.AAC.1